MRVTNSMMINSLMHNLEKNLNRMGDQQQHLSSGKRVNRASDDPIDASKILKFKSDLSEFEQYDKNVRDSLNWYEVTESSVAEVGELLQRSRELAVKAANGVNTADDLKKIAEEIHNIRKQLINTGNANFAGKYIFSGYQTDKELFNVDGSFNIDITTTEFSRPPRMSWLVGAGESMQTSTSGLNVFGMTEESVVYDELMTDSAGDHLVGNKSAIKARVDLKSSLTSSTLDVNFNGSTFAVDTVGLVGSEESPISKGVLIDRFKRASDGTNTLADFAEIYYDDNENLVIEAKADGLIPISSASAHLKTVTLYTGAVAAKSVLKGAFAFEGPDADYTAENLDVTLSGIGTFDIDEVTLNGYTFDLDKQKVIKAFSEAPNSAIPGSKLSDYADIYFDHNDQLVIKDKRYGANTITVAGSPGFNPSFTSGRATEEAQVSFPRSGFDDAYINDHQTELKRSPLYITYNGERKAVKLDPSANITTTAAYQTELQNAIDTAFGSAKIAVSLTGAAPNEHLNFTTVATADGTAPELRVEAIKTQKSSLIEDMKGFHKALMNNDQAAIQKFLGNVDKHLDRVISERASIGAKVSRMELIKNRLSANTVSFTGMLSLAQDVDMAQEVMTLKNAENIYRASLTTGGRVIQPTLVDFLR